MYWREVPYRIASVLRGLVQSQGLLSATRIPQFARDSKWGRAWCAAPSSPTGIESIESTAEDIILGKLEVFGREVSMPNGVPDWNVDPVTGIRIEQTFGLFIDFRHIGAGIDIKYLWEVNRHLWWVPLAQSYAINGNRRALDTLRIQLSSWLAACPYPMGPNWSSPVEHGVRLINWSVVWCLIGGADSPIFAGVQGKQLLDRWLESIYQHIRFASDNYSLYSSADNHLIGEAAGVFVAAHTWDQWPETRDLRAQAKAILEREVRRQFSLDGVDLEQAICYHKFALQFLIASGLCGRANGDEFSVDFWARVEKAIEFLASVIDCAGNVPQIGDSDDSDVWRLGHTTDFNSHRSLVSIGAALFQRADLQAKARSINHCEDGQVSWLGIKPGPLAEPADMHRLPTTFDSGGYIVMGDSLHSKHEFRVTFDCGPLGYNRVAGHGHADALALLISWEGDPLLVDSGTFCYSADPKYRRFFRSTHAHNTVVIDGQDQSEYGASFLWLRDVNTSVVRDDIQAGVRTVHACHDGYRRLADPVVHHRRVSLEPHDGPLIVEDWIECVRAHDVELLWHAAPGAQWQRSGKHWELQTVDHLLQVLVDGAEVDHEIIEGRDQPPQGWVSTRFYQRSPAPVLVSRARLEPQQKLRTRIQRVQKPVKLHGGPL